MKLIEEKNGDAVGGAIPTEDSGVTLTAPVRKARKPRSDIGKPRGPYKPRCDRGKPRGKYRPRKPRVEIIVNPRT